jgi:hypothetical protein
MKLAGKFRGSKAFIALFFVVIIVISFGNPPAQNNRCKFLLTALKNKDITAIFGLDKHRGSPIQIIDLRKKFSECGLNEVYNRKISISSDTQGIRVANYSTIIVHDFIKVRNTFRLYLEYKNTGAYGYVELIYKKGNIVVSKTEIGHF